jgi:hypothetical protein
MNKFNPDPDWLEWTKVKFEFKRGKPTPLFEYVRENPLMQPEQREFVADILSGDYNRKHDRGIDDRYGLLALKLKADQKRMSDSEFREFLVEWFTSNAGPDDDPQQQMESAMKTIGRHYDTENKCMKVKSGKKTGR